MGASFFYTPLSKGGGRGGCLYPLREFLNNPIYVPYEPLYKNRADTQVRPYNNISVFIKFTLSISYNANLKK